MDIKEFKAGYYRKGYQYQYFVPNMINHPFVWTDGTINELLEISAMKLGELNSFSRLIPNTSMFIMMHTFKEAVVSSRIEGTRTNIEEALIGEKDVDPEKRDEWQEVNNYVRAMNVAQTRLQTLPLSNRLLKETHKILLTSGRGSYKNPGAFRESQNWIGGVSLADAVFIPPSHIEIPDLMSDLEKFINNPDLRIPHLLKIAIAHYQFETIHPFLDGNGRIGRLLITLYLVANHILGEPLLYLSDFFERNKSLYYDNLSLVRTQNNLTQWIRFFLAGVIETADKSVSTLDNVIRLKEKLEKNQIMCMGRRAKPALKLLHYLFKKPVVSIKDVQEVTELTPKAANELVRAFEEGEILKEITGYRRNRIFSFTDYLHLFS